MAEAVEEEGHGPGPDFPYRQTRLVPRVVALMGRHIPKKKTKKKNKKKFGINYIHPLHLI